MGVITKFKYIEMKGKNVKVQMFDTAGQEKFRVLAANYYHGADGVLVVYDCTDMESFKSIIEWLSQIEQNAGPNVQKFLVANKIDFDKANIGYKGDVKASTVSGRQSSKPPEVAKQRVITTEMGRKCADDYGMYYMEASAKTGQGVDETFTQIAQ